MSDPFKAILLDEAGSANLNLSGKGSFVSSCPSNIAIVKYWGKYGEQKPRNPSLSYTLGKAQTISTVDWECGIGMTPSTRFLFEGKPAPAFESKVQAFIRTASTYLPFLRQAQLSIDSRNTFPHSSGIASSASAMGALALAFCTIESDLLKLPKDQDFYRKASFLARLGSGSASRSVYEGFVLWGKTPGIKESSDEYAIPLENVHQNFSDIQDSILIIDSSGKKVSSSEGHTLMKGHPYAKTRYREAMKNLDRLLAILAAGDWDAFIRLMEHEALSLHAMMMTSNPGYLLLREGSIKAIEELNNFRRESGIPLGFTLDAGANVHILYPGESAEKVRRWIDTDVRKFCENGQVINA